MKAEDYTKITCIHRKVFEDPGMTGNGTQVQIYYRFCHDLNSIQIEDYSIQLIIDGVAGLNVADDSDLIDDEMYQHMFKEAYHELVDHVILKK